MERCVLRVKELVVRSGICNRGGKRCLSSTVRAINREDRKVEETMKEERRYSPYSTESAWMPHPVTGDFVPESHFSDFHVYTTMSSVHARPSDFYR